MPMATVALVREGPRIVTSPMARMRNGNDSQASVSRMITWSIVRR